MKLKNRIVCILTIGVLLFTAVFDVYSQKHWYRGNTHTHTTYSDGKLYPEGVVELYKNEGYNFIFITDHGNVAPIDEELLSDSSFICISGEESESFHHLSCLNIDKTINSIYPPEIIDSTIKQGGFLIVNHPMRGNHEVYARDIWDVDEFEHIEIVNTKSEKDGYHDDQSLWDTLLTSGKFFYGIAADDFHETKHLAKGWIMVRADTLQKDSIINAIKGGDFYSSTGLYFSLIEVNDTSIKIKAPGAEQIVFIGNNRTYLQTSNCDSAIYDIEGNEGYIRVEALDSIGQKAWTQPLFWDKIFTGVRADTTIANEICEGESNITDACIYYVTTESSAGKDSIIKVHASIISVPDIFNIHSYTINSGDTIQLTPVSDFDKYLWNTSDTVKSISLIGNNESELKYWLRIKEKGCYFSDTVSVSVIEPSFIERSNNYDKAIIYPNPAKSYITLKTGHISGNTSFILCNSDGAIIKKGEFIGDTVVNINGLNQGVYFVKINNKNDFRCIKIVVTD